MLFKSNKFDNVNPIQTTENPLSQTNFDILKQTFCKNTVLKIILIRFSSSKFSES